MFKNTISTAIPVVAILSFIFAVGAIDDCGGHCMGQENWIAFWMLLINGLLFGYITIKLQDRD